MDALTGLGGSSSESESELSRNGNGDGNSDGDGNVGAASLFAGYSDDGNGSSDSDLETNNVNENVKPSRKRRRAGGKDVVVTADRNGKSQSSNNLEQSRNNSSSSSSSKLPSPQLLSPPINGSKDGPQEGHQGLYLCYKDYLKEHILSKAAVGPAATAHETQESNSYSTAKTDLQLKNKLDQMYNNFYSKRSIDDMKTITKEGTSSSSFARKLKSQKDFGNPYLFPSVVEHFGIEPMGSSCIPNEFWNAKVAQSSTTSTSGNDDGDFAAFEFIERLIVKEEENRLRAHNGI